MADLASTLQNLTSEYQTIQKDLADVITARQKLDSQLQENEVVKKEFSTLAPTANIYKLIGPVLLKQDRDEAALNVDKRLEYISSEIKRIEGQLKDLEEKSEKKRIEIIQIQTQLQSGATGGVGPGAAKASLTV
ncbi:Prefoldin [Kalaharituber pfeilii]|nr:Prefoldin [Kalaharituber pfeilii]